MSHLKNLFRIVAIAIAFFVFVPSAIHAAESAAPAGAEGEAKPKKAPKKESLMDTIRQGGAIMIPIGICLVFTIYLIIDLYMRLATKKLIPDADVTAARTLFQAGDYVNAYQAMKISTSAYAKCVRYGLSFVGKGKEATEEALLTEVGRENARIQNRINYLSVIGVCSPMIGLLGTVIGMKGAFAALGAEGAGDVNALSEHIGEVLVATAAGLFIAIPAFMMFYMLRNRLAAQVHMLEDSVFSLYRNMPYEHFQDLEIGEEVTYAAVPNWVEQSAQ